MKTSSPTNFTPRIDTHKGRLKQPLSSSALYAGNEECTLQCVFYKKNHKSITCSTITEPKARRTILRRSGRSARGLVFLKEGHITPGCQSKAKCFNCGAGHHMAICENPKKPVQPSGSGAELASFSRSETSQERSGDLEHQQCILEAIITLNCCRQPKPLLLDQIIRKLECILNNAQNAYCSRDIYFQFSKVCRSVISCVDAMKTPQRLVALNALGCSLI